MNYITGKQAQLILEITTRQGLHKILREHPVEVQSQGVGKPNLYLKSDIEAIKKLKDKKPTAKHKQKTIKNKVEKQKKTIKETIDKVEELREDKPPNLIITSKNTDITKEDFNPLTKIGQEEYLRVESLLIKNGTFEDLDCSLLLSYAISYQKYINAVAMSADVDDIFCDMAGNVKVHPYFTIAKECHSQMMKAANVLGIGNRNRIGLEIKKEPKKSVFDMLNEKEEF